MRTLRVGLDVDNVLYPWTTIFTRWAEEYRDLEPGTLDDIALSWDFHKDQWGWTSAEFLEVYVAGIHAGVIFTEGDAETGSLSAVRRLANFGHEIHYITHREVGNVDAELANAKTREWLERQGFPITSITVSENKAAIPTDIFLDDGPHNIEALIAAGHPCPVLWERSHNWHFDTKHSLNSWHDFGDMVDALAGIS